nr:immunoglobulin light chain junction region [Macaca mulatta]MOW56893.1 immunoglobulin light chain junction region [Macaca mulatta]MOW57239.1 immunoglobulin light chain junction region [Macaca mulatta]MOW57588.1 immunoglobulin light chain junction region [Macaca mulatta]MOW57939.1 immunoglobulin light chain junction region [Macaca mulatta]
DYYCHSTHNSGGHWVF